MALGNPSSAGTGVTAGAVSSANFTATAAAGRLYIATHWVSSSARTLLVSGGGLTWTTADKFVPKTTVAGLALWSADNPSGVSAQTITATWSGAIGGAVILGWQQTGVATSSPTDGAGSSALPANGGGTYSTGAGTTTNANDTIYALMGCDNFGGQASTPSGTVINELFDFHGTNDIHLAVNWVNVTATGSYTGTGAWSAGPVDEIDMLLAYKEDTGGGGAVTVKQLAALGVG